jgi:hypothetical protein
LTKKAKRLNCTLMLMSRFATPAQLMPMKRGLGLILQCESVKERFLNLERRFSGYRKFLGERTGEDEVEHLRRDGLQWFREQIGMLQVVKRAQF